MKSFSEVNQLFCFICGYHVTEKHKYCTNCGTKITFTFDEKNNIIIELPPEVECTNCGSIISSKNLTCGECGIKIDKKHLRLVKPISINSQETNYLRNNSLLLRNKTSFSLKTFFTSIVLLFIFYLVIDFLIDRLYPLKIQVYGWDSSMISIKNNEGKVIELIDITINTDYVLDYFPTEIDTNNYFSLAENFGRGKKFINPNEKIDIHTKFFADMKGRIFNSLKTKLKNVVVSAKISNGFFGIRTYYGQWK